MVVSFTKVVTEPQVWWLVRVKTQRLIWTQRSAILLAPGRVGWDLILVSPLFLTGSLSNKVCSLRLNLSWSFRPQGSRWRSRTGIKHLSRVIFFGSSRILGGPSVIPLLVRGIKDPLHPSSCQQLPLYFISFHTFCSVDCSSCVRSLSEPTFLLLWLIKKKFFIFIFWIGM